MPLSPTIVNVKAPFSVGVPESRPLAWFGVGSGAVEAVAAAGPAWDGGVADWPQAASTRARVGASSRGAVLIIALQ